MSDEQARQAADGVPTGVELTALDPAFRADPYPVLERLREREPAHTLTRYRRCGLSAGPGAVSPLRSLKQGFS